MVRLRIIASKTVTVKLYDEMSMCFIPVPFDPKVVFGKIRAPVRVTLNGYTYRSTICVMGGLTRVPLRKAHKSRNRIAGSLGPSQSRRKESP